MNHPERVRKNRRWPAGSGSRSAILAATLLLSGCASSSLELWHTTRLSEDFSAGDEIQTFAEYLDVERRAFEELDEKIVSEVPTAPEYALVRYSRGSLSDPASFPQNFNRSYELEAESPRGAVLLIHGMSDSPYSLRAVGVSFNEAGYHVLNLRLPGHGTAPVSLTQVRWQDFAAAVELAMAHLKDVVVDRPIHMVGFSNGAPLALNYAIDSLDNDHRSPASLILIAPAIGVSGAAALAAPKASVGRVPGLGGLQYTQVLPAFDPFRYNAFPTNGATQTHRITRRVASGVSRLVSEGRAESLPPILVIKSSVDATVSNDAVVDRLLGLLPDNGNELILFDVNRRATTSSVLVQNPGPFARRLVDDTSLPFAVTLVSNETEQSERVSAFRKPPFAGDFSPRELLAGSWPSGVVSLSHIGLTFPPDDPLYGQEPPANENQLFLGGPPLRGERGILRVPDNWFTRQRFNPFYDYMEARILQWCETVRLTAAVSLTH